MTAQSLSELFAKHMLRGRLRMPGDAELKELASILEYWRLVFQNEQPLHHRRQLQDKGLAALKALSDVLSNIAELDAAELNAAVRESAPAGIIRKLGERSMTINDVRRVIERIGTSRALVESPASHGFERWQWLADVLPEDFVNAMKLSNPTFAPGLGHTGPVARFIEAVVPVLTGEHPTAASIATQLKMRRQAHREAPGR